MKQLQGSLFHRIRFNRVRGSTSIGGFCRNRLIQGKQFLEYFFLIFVGVQASEDAKHHYEVATKPFLLLNHPFILNELSRVPFDDRVFYSCSCCKQTDCPGTVDSDRPGTNSGYLNHAEFFMHIANRKNPGFTIVSGTAGFWLFDELDLGQVF